MSEVKATTISVKMDGIINEALKGLDKEALAIKELPGERLQCHEFRSVAWRMKLTAEHRKALDGTHLVSAVMRRPLS